MKVTPEHNERIVNMKFASVYPHYLARIEKKGRTKEELHEVISWLTGYSEAQIQEFIKSDITFGTFYEEANIHPNAHLIKGVVCGYRIEDIEYPITKKARYLDKLIDELARGRKMEKILRVEKVKK